MFSNAISIEVSSKCGQEMRAMLKNNNNNNTGTRITTQYEESRMMDDSKYGIQNCKHQQVGSLVSAFLDSFVPANIERENHGEKKFPSEKCSSRTHDNQGGNGPSKGGTYGRKTWKLGWEKCMQNEFN